MIGKIKQMAFTVGTLSLFLATAAYAQSPTPGKYYQLVSRYSGLCLDVTDHSFAEGTQLQQWNCTGHANQRFLLIQNMKGAVQLKNQESGRYVKVADESLENGGRIIQSENNSGNSPRINLQPSASGTYKVQFANSGKCLDVAGPSVKAGTKLQQWDCHGTPNQDWHLVEQTEGMGELTWSVTNSSLFIDKLKRLYRQEYSENSIRAVDKVTGRDLWVFTSPTYHVLYPTCNDQNHVYAVGEGVLKAINPDNGELQWNFDSKDEWGSVYCPSDDGALYFSSSRSDAGKFRSVDRDTGAIRWEYAPKGFTAFVGKQGRNIFLTVYDSTTNSVTNLDSETGRVKWSRILNTSEWANAFVNGDIYLSQPNSVEKIDPETGKAAWIYTDANGEGDVTPIWNTASVPYVRNGRDVIRLDRATGRVLWSHTIPESVGTSNSTSLILNNGDALFRTTDTSNNMAQTLLFNDEGRKLWENSAPTADSAIFEDQSGMLFLQGLGKLSWIDRKSGTTNWSFSRESPLANETFYGAQTYGEDVFVLYGIPSGRYPAMGIVRLDAKSGALQWDEWIGVTTSLIDADSKAGLLYTNRMFGGTYVYKR